MATRTQQPDDDVGHRQIVLHQQDPQHRQLDPRHVLRIAGHAPALLRPGQRQLDGKARAVAGTAVDGDASAHRHRQLLADRQAQAAAAIPRRGARAVGLFEAMEQPLLLLGVDARAGVGHLERQPQAVVQKLHAEPDVAALGELDRVAQQVHQDLAHAHFIAAHLHRPGQVETALEGQAAMMGHRFHQRLHLGQHRHQVERTDVQLQPPGLDPGQVQRIVDQPQQVRAGVLDRGGVAALQVIQRGGQQQFAHAQYAGHRRAHFVPERGQELALGLRGLLGDLLLVHRQLPLLAPPQAHPRHVHHRRHQQQPQQQVGQDRPAAAPPRRQHLHAERARRRPLPLRRGGLHIDGVLARGKPRQQPLAVGGLHHPVLVIARDPVAVAVALRIGEGQQACGDDQVAVLRTEHDRRIRGQRLLALGVVAADLQVVDHQLRWRHRQVGRIRIETDQPGGSHRQDPAIGGAHWRAPAELHVGQAVALTIDAQPALRPVPAHQATRRGRPHQAPAAGHHPAHRYRRQALGRPDAFAQGHAQAIPAIALQGAVAGQPDLVRAGPGDVVDAAPRNPRHLLEAALVPAQQAHVAHDPQLPARIEQHLLDRVFSEPAVLVDADGIEHLAVGVAALDAVVHDRQPQLAVGRLADQIDALAHIGPAADLPFAQLPGARLVQAQPPGAPDPQGAVGARQQRPVRAHAQLLVIGDLAQRAALVQLVDAVRAGNVEGVAGRGGAEQVDAVQWLAVELVPGGEAFPVRRQVGQALGEHGDPQAALMVLQHVQHAAARGEETAARIAGQQVRGVMVAAVQPIGSAQPVAAVAVVDHRGRAHVRAQRPRRLAHAAIGIDAEQAAFGAGPDRAVGLAGQPEHALAAELVRGDAGEAVTVPARHAVAGPHPHPALRVGQQAVNGVVGQAGRVIGVGVVLHQRAVFLAATDAVPVGADPQRLGRIGQRPELTFAALVELGEAFEAFAPGAEHAQARAIGAHPDPVQRIHQQRFHFIAGDRIGVGRVVPPYPQTHAVHAGQAIIGGRPDVALPVLAQRQHHARGHAFGRTQAAHARRLRRRSCCCPRGPRR
ncbi:hypothetical protein D3C71_874490 [compost metagenome]